MRNKGIEMGTKISLGEAARRMKGYGSISTGSDAVDSLLGGGIRVGRVLEVFGESKSGKSQLAMQASMCAASSGLTAVYIDTEGAFRPERIREMAEARKLSWPQVLARIQYLRVSSSAEQVEAVGALADGEATRASRLVVIDTLTRNFTLDYSGTSNMHARQAAIDTHLGAIARDAFLNGRAYLLTNRVTFAAQGQVEHIGGLTVSQLVHDALRLTREGDRVRVQRVGSGRSVTCALGQSGIV